MFIVINKISNESAIIKEKQPLADHLGISRNTVYKHSKELMWETDKFIIYKPQIILIKSARGGTNSGNLLKGMSTRG